MRLAVQPIDGRLRAGAMISRAGSGQDRGGAQRSAGGDRARRRRVLRRLRRARHPEPHARHVLPGRRRHGGADAGRRAAQRFSTARPVKRQVSHILWDPIMAEKGGYKHFMLKEIFEQPRAVRDTILGRVGQEIGPHLPRRDGHHAGGVRASSSRCGSSPAAPAGTPRWPASS